MASEDNTGSAPASVQPAYLFAKDWLNARKRVDDAFEQGSEHLGLDDVAEMLRDFAAGRAALAAPAPQAAAAEFENMRARTLLAHLWRVYDAAGTSMGRSHESVVLEAAMALLGDPRPEDMALLDADSGTFINATRSYLSDKMAKRLTGAATLMANGPAEPAREPCIGRDPKCPCQDGDTCHYRGRDAFPIPAAASVATAEPNWIADELADELKRLHALMKAGKDAVPAMALYTRLNSLRNRVQSRAAASVATAEPAPLSRMKCHKCDSRAGQIMRKGSDFFDCLECGAFTYVEGINPAASVAGLAGAVGVEAQQFAERVRDGIADFVGDNWPMRKHGLAEIEAGIRAIEIDAARIAAQAASTRAGE